MARPIEERNPACEECIYWVEDALPNPQETGNCRRLPPVGPGNAGVPTDHDHWCGEWTERGPLT